MFCSIGLSDAIFLFQAFILVLSRHSHICAFISLLNLQVDRFLDFICTFLVYVIIDN